MGKYVDLGMEKGVAGFKMTTAQCGLDSTYSLPGRMNRTPREWGMEGSRVGLAMGAAVNPAIIVRFGDFVDGEIKEEGDGLIAHDLLSFLFSFFFVPTPGAVSRCKSKPSKTRDSWAQPDAPLCGVGARET